jgi:hypothetical protein
MGWRPAAGSGDERDLASGDYDRHLRRLKRRIAEGVRAVVAQVKASFPRYPR